MRTFIVALLVPIASMCGAVLLFNTAPFQVVHWLVAAIE